LMLVEPQVFLAMRCPHCQEQLLYRSFSDFRLLSGKEMEVSCSSCDTAFTIRVSGKKHAYIDLFCPCCQEKHSYIYKLTEMRNAVLSLDCGDTDLHLAYIGEKDKVLEALDEEGFMIIAYQDELREYFASPSLMAKALIEINRLFRQSGIVCSVCGSKEFDLEAKGHRIGITCAHCEARGFLYAARPADVHLLKKAQSIRLFRGGLRLRYTTGGRKYSIKE